jgi:sodium transport system ATP-binding protein
LIRAEHLCKSFGAVEAAKDVSFTAHDGRVTALLGPNGAGKSTTLRILSTIIRPDAGKAFIGEHEVSGPRAQVLSAIGVLPHNAGLYDRLTARENIAYFGALHGLEKQALTHRIDTLIEELGMAEFAERKVGGFSQGQRIKVALARAIVHEPQHLLLDEPTNGLDVMATRALREIILTLKNQGRCVLFSSHIMQEVTNLCDDVIIIGGGEVRFHGTLTQLQQESGEDDLEDAFLAKVGAIE